MKTFEQHVGEVSETWEHSHNAAHLYEQAAKRYATQVAQDALNRAAQNAEARIVRKITKRDTVREIVYVDKESITNTKIILP